MNEKEREDFLALLAQTRDEFLASLDGVSEEQAQLKPAPDRWSIVECVEHVVVAEHAMYIGITTRRTPRTSTGEGRERAIMAMASDRSRKFEAPETARPKGRFGTLAQNVEKFRENRARTMEYVASCGEDLRAFELQHPMAGLVTAQECLAIIVAHPSRHAKQIHEARKSFARGA
jgi:hypothetical protein